VSKVPGPAPAQSSNAAQWLADREIAQACGGPGTFDTGGIIERDLTGDGRDDLILSHEAIRCASGGRSGFCGAQVCSVLIFVRDGDLMVEKTNMLGGGVSVSVDRSPVISGYGHGGGRWSIRWTGSAFR